MCYSPEVSFTVAGGLLVVGGYTTWNATETPWQRFAMVPLLFAIQQFAEGILWLYLLRDQPIATGAVISRYTYQFFAYLFWPVWFPFAMFPLALSFRKKVLIQIALGFGIVIALFNLTGIVNENIPTIVEQSIWYDRSSIFHRISYLFPILLALVCSSHKEMLFYALAIFVSFVVSQIFYEKIFTSIWCFHAALISFFVLWVIRKKCSTKNKR